MESEIDHVEIRILGIVWTGWRRNFQRRFARGSEKMSPYKLRGQRTSLLNPQNSPGEQSCSRRAAVSGSATS